MSTRIKRFGKDVFPYQTCPEIKESPLEVRALPHTINIDYSEDPETIKLRYEQFFSEHSHWICSAQAYKDKVIEFSGCKEVSFVVFRHQHFFLEELCHKLQERGWISRPATLRELVECRIKSISGMLYRTIALGTECTAPELEYGGYPMVSGKRGCRLDFYKKSALLGRYSQDWILTIPGPKFYEVCN